MHIHLDGENNIFFIASDQLHRSYGMITEFLIILFMTARRKINEEIDANF